MKKLTISSAFAELREREGLSFLAIANKCDISEAVVWKLESDRSVRWETVHLILSVAFNIQPGSEKYDQFNRLWLKDRQERAESQPADHAARKLSKHAANAVKKFRTLIHDMDEPSAKKVLAAAERAADKLRADRHQ